MRTRLGRTRNETTKVYRDAIREMMLLYHYTGFTVKQAQEVASKHQITRAIASVLLKAGMVERTNQGYKFTSLTIDERKLWKGRQSYKHKKEIQTKDMIIKKVSDSSGCKTPLEEAIAIVKAAGFKVMKAETTWTEC